MAPTHAVGAGVASVDGPGIGFCYPEDIIKYGSDVYAIKATAEFHGSAP